MDKTFAFYIGGIQPANIDESAGIIRDVRLITEGSALGHNVDIDGKTIDQLLASCLSYKSGVKVKMDHGGGAGDIAGYVTNFRKQSDSTGEYLLGDLHLFANHPQRDYILELAKTIPDTFGLSCFFVGKPEVVDGRSKARCSRVFSCDIVTEPAANPSLFNIGPVLRSAETTQVDKPKKSMTPEEFATCMEAYEKNKASAAGAPAAPHVKETHEIKPDGSERHVVTKTVPDANASPDADDEEKLAALLEKHGTKMSARILETLTKQGVRIAPAVATVEATQLSAKPSAPATPVTKTFEDICLGLRTTGDESGKKYSVEDAVGFAIRNYPAEHQNYLERCEAEGNTQYKFMQLSRAASKDASVFVPPFQSKVEHWKVQGTPKPGAQR